MKLFLLFIALCVFPHCIFSQSNYQFDFLNRLTAVTLSNGTQIQYTYDELGNRISKTISGGGYSISGQVLYAKPAGGVAMNNMQLKLKNSNGDIIQTVSSSVLGNYQFSNVPNGTYTIVPGTTLTWAASAATSLDLFLFQQDLLGITPLGTFYKLAGDVNMSSTTTSLDLYLIQSRILGISSTFTSGDWLFENAAVTILGGNQVKNLNTLMYGDANGSYNP